MVRNFCHRPSLGLWVQKFLRVKIFWGSFWPKKWTKWALSHEKVVLWGGVKLVSIKSFDPQKYSRKIFFGCRNFYTDFWKFSFVGFFSKNLILLLTSNWPNIPANGYFPLKKNMLHNYATYLRGCRNFWQSLAKMKKNEFRHIRFWRRNFCTMTEISAENQSLDIMSKHIVKISTLTGYN